MAVLNLYELADKMEGEILQGSPSLIFSRYDIDSRTIEAGDLFFAIQAKRDGHDFLPHADQKGAAGAVISHDTIYSSPNLAMIKVKDTLAALQHLARKIQEESNIQIVGITGSAGKTTTKEFVSALISDRFSILKSEGNFNNHIGLPLSLLQLEVHNEVAVLEYGMNSRGEIAALTRIAPPDIAVITNIHPVHLEFFQDINEIALAKKEILDGMNPDGIAVLNGENVLVRQAAQKWTGKKIFFGSSDPAFISAGNIRVIGWEGMTFDLNYGEESEKIFLPFFNRGMLSNFLAAAATAYALGVPLDEVALRAKNLSTFSHRGTLIELNRGIKIIDDSYNSNPAALELALHSLVELTGERKTAVLGDMLELGENAPDYHIQAGKHAARSGLDRLITVGSLALFIAEGAQAAGMRPEQITSFQDTEEAQTKILELILENDIVLIKGSRGIRMEKIVTSLKKRG